MSWFGCFVGWRWKSGRFNEIISRSHIVTVIHKLQINQLISNFSIQNCITNCIYFQNFQMGQPVTLFARVEILLSDGGTGKPFTLFVPTANFQHVIIFRAKLKEKIPRFSHFELVSTSCNTGSLDWIRSFPTPLWETIIKKRKTKTLSIFAMINPWFLKK